MENMNLENKIVSDVELGDVSGCGDPSNNQSNPLYHVGDIVKINIGAAKCTALVLFVKHESVAIADTYGFSYTIQLQSIVKSNDYFLNYNAGDILADIPESRLMPISGETNSHSSDASGGW